MKGAFADLGRLFVAGLIGVLIACCVFLPTVLYFMQDSRASVEHAFSLLYSAKHYSQLLLNISTTSSPGDWSFISIGIVGLIALGSLFAEGRKNAQLIIAAIAFLAMLCVPFVGYAFNGFSYVANRWCWVFCLVGGMAIATRWEALLRLTLRQALILLGLTALYLIVCVVLNWGYMPHKGLAVVAAMWLLSAICIAVVSYANEKRRTSTTARIASGMLLVATCAGICMNGLALYSPIGGAYAKDFLTVSETPTIYETEANAVAELTGYGDAGNASSANADNDFFRFSSSYNYSARNAGSLVGLSSTTYYWSLSNAHIKNFFHQMGINGSDYKGYCWHDLNGQSTLAELVGVKYYAAKEGTLKPYGYESESSATKTLHDTRFGGDFSIDVFTNKAPLPFGYTYSRAIDWQSFEDLTPEQRREAVLQACVVSDATPTRTSIITNNQLSYSSNLLAFNVKCGENVKQDGKSFVVGKKESKVTLNVDAPKNAEVTLQFDNLVINASGATDFTLPVTFTYNDGTTQDRILSVGTTKSISYEPFRYHAISPGYYETKLKSITIEFPSKGTYSWDDLQVVAQRFDRYDAQIAELSKDSLQDVDLHYLSERTAATNRITGRIQLSEPKTLCTQIPYSSGWRVRVDGADAELLNLNVMFAGVALEPGEHEVEFIYETPGAFAGTILTLVGIALLAAMLFLQHRTRTQNAAAHEKRQDHAFHSRP